MFYYLRFIFGVLLIFLVGNALLKTVDRQRGFNTLAERFFLSYSLGIGAIAFIQFYAMLVGMRINKISLLLLLSPFLAWQLYYFTKRVKAIDMLGEKAPYPKEKKIYLKDALLCGGLVSYLILLSAMMLFICLFFPTYAYDPRATWAFKAKILFHQGTFFTADFFDPYRFHANTSYPLLLPLAESFFYNILGVADDYLVKVIFALFYISLALFLYITQKKYFGTTRLHGLIFTTVSLSVPFLFNHLQGGVCSAYADFPLACLYTFNIVYLLRYICDRNKTNLILASLFASFTIFIKNEGIVLFLLSVAILVIDALVAGYFKDKEAKEALLVYILIPIVLALPWFWLKRQLPVVYDNSPLPYLSSANIIKGFSFLGLIMKLTLREMFTNLQKWGIIWVIILLAMMINFRRKPGAFNQRAEFYLLFVPLFYYFFIITPIYMFYIPNVASLADEFNGASFERLRLHTLFLLLLFVSLRINRLFNREGS
jgi:hypothetical protein